MADFKSLVDEAVKIGWSSGTGSLDYIQRTARQLGWTEVAPRRGEQAVSVLKPTTKSAAKPRSLSAIYGLGAQPLHSDGAHMPEPPDFVVLLCEKPSPTPTMLFRPGTYSRKHHLPYDAATHGMFVVSNGRDSFYSPLNCTTRYRYDPGCMTACDARALEVMDYLTEALTRAKQHDWTVPGQFLLIDNRRTLHARAAVADGGADRLLTRVAFRKGLK